MLNPATAICSGVAGFVIWSLSNDVEKARIKKALATPPIYSESPPTQHQGIEIPPASPPSPQPQRKAYGDRVIALQSLLHQHGLSLLWEMRNTTPLRFVGWQRSGKSTKAQVIALFRQLDNPDHPICVGTPHQATPGDFAWSPSIAVAGEGFQWAQIKNLIERYHQRIHASDTSPHSLILDEFSGYAEIFGTELIQGLMLSLVRESAKHNEMVALICHGSTSAMNGGIRGLSDAVLGNFITVECTNQRIDGKAIPSPEFYVYGGGYQKTGYSWPSWLTPEWLLSQFPELLGIQPPALSPPSGEPTLLDIPPAVSPSPFHPEIQPIIEGLEPHLKALFFWLHAKGKPCKVRDIQQAKIPELVGGEINKSDPIRLCLDTLAYHGLGEWQMGESFTVLGVGGDETT